MMVVPFHRVMCFLHGMSPATCVHSCAMSITLVQEVEDSAFDREAVFQVGYEDGGSSVVLYVQAGDHVTRTDWLSHLRHVAARSPKPKAPTFHPSIYDKSWRCCLNGNKGNPGCRKTFFASQTQDAAGVSPDAATGAAASPGHAATTTSLGEFSRLPSYPSASTVIS